MVVHKYRSNGTHVRENQEVIADIAQVFRFLKPLPLKNDPRGMFNNFRHILIWDDSTAAEEYVFGPFFLP